MQFLQQMFLFTPLPEVMICFPGAELEQGCFWKGEIVILDHERALPAAGFPSAQTPARIVDPKHYLLLFPSPSPPLLARNSLFLRLESLWRWSFPVQMHSSSSKQTGWESSKISHPGGNYTLFPQKELMWLGRLFPRSGLACGPHSHILGAYTWICCRGAVGKAELRCCKGTPTRHLGG